MACRRHFETAEDVQAHSTLTLAHPKCNDCGRGFKDDDARNAVSVILCCTFFHPNILKKNRDRTDIPISLRAQTTEVDNVLPLEGRDGDLAHPPSKVDKPLSGPGLVRKGFLFFKIYYIDISFILRTPPLGKGEWNRLTSDWKWILLRRSKK
jgi:hypothetical protein